MPSKRTAVVLGLLILVAVSSAMLYRAHMKEKRLEAQEELEAYTLWHSQKLAEQAHQDSLLVQQREDSALFATCLKKGRVVRLHSQSKNFLASSTETLTVTQSRRAAGVILQGSETGGMWNSGPGANNGSWVSHTWTLTCNGVLLSDKQKAALSELIQPPMQMRNRSDWDYWLYFTGKASPDEHRVLRRYLLDHRLALTPGRKTVVDITTQYAVR